MSSSNGYSMYIGGEWKNSNGTFSDYNPATGEVWAEIPDASRDDAKQAIKAAAAAQVEWAALSHPERAKYLLRAADIMEAQLKPIAGKIVAETGGWIGKGMFEGGYVPGVFRSAAAAVYQLTGEILPSDHHKVSMVMRQPVGGGVGYYTVELPLFAVITRHCCGHGRGEYCSTQTL